MSGVGVVVVVAVAAWVAAPVVRRVLGRAAS